MGKSPPSCRWPTGRLARRLTGFRTSVALFSNGTFSNLAFVQGSDVYEAWMRRALDEAITPYQSDQRLPTWGANVCPKVEVDIAKPWSVSRGLAYIQQIFFHSKPESKTQVKAAADKTEPLGDMSPLIDLIGELKKETESKLGYSLSRVATSYPSFFNANLTNHLAQALQSLSLSDDGCHGDGRSSVASLVAHRQTEFDLERPTRPLDCIYGQPGFENVVHIENTEQALAISAFEFFAEEHTTWAQEGYRRPTYLKKRWISPPKRSTEHSQNNATDFSTSPDSEFWADAQACLEDYFSAQWNSRHDAVYRLILAGSQSHDAELLQILQKTRGIVEMRPRSSPVVLRVHRDKDEISRQYVKRWSGISCRPNDPSYVYGDLWGDYGELLLASISREPHRFNTSIDPRFSAARGAALYSLESRLTPCTNLCDMTSCREKRSQVDLEDFGRDRYHMKDLDG